MATAAGERAACTQERPLAGVIREQMLERRDGLVWERTTAVVGDQRWRSGVTARVCWLYGRARLSWLLPGSSGAATESSSAGRKAEEASQYGEIRGRQCATEGKRQR